VSASRRRRTAAATGLGLAGAVAGAGIALRRRTADRVHLPVAPPAGLLADLAGERGVVLADDGLPLATVRRGSGPPTVVFVHGYCVDRRSWHYQWNALASWRSGGARLVAYDLRSHGGSARSRPEAATLAQLGRDLLAVLAAEVPGGSVVLVGHSMGGMTIMALADAHPELFGPRVVGVALLSTSAGKLGELSYGLPAGVGVMLKHVSPWAVPLLGQRSHLIDAGRRAGGPLGAWLTKRYSFASEVPPERVALMTTLIESTPFAVMADFFPAFASHDKLRALGVLRSVPTLVLVGDADLQTPADHSREIARAVPAAELVVVPRAGHMVMLEHPEVVSARLADLLDRACPA